VSTGLLRLVVLAGSNLTARQSLAAKLQAVLLEQTLAFDFLCPAIPQDLKLTPADARYVLWRSPLDDKADESHNAWRTQLHELQRAYQTVHGDDATVFQQTLFALSQGLPLSSAREEIQGRWQGLCECCADPACEQKLFGRLLQG
jgi:hypothetical protein